MKFISMIPILIMLTSCDKIITKNVENPYNNADNEARLKELESRVFDLEVQANGNIESLLLLTQLMNDMGDQNTNSIANIMTRVEDLEGDTTTLLTEMVTLRGYSITNIIDPCGDSAGYDEVLLRTGSGKLIAYFESGASRYLSVIPYGSYRTTDGTNCYFEVTSNGTVLHIVDGVIYSD